MEIRFRELKIQQSAKTTDGKRRQKTFTMTVNPFNRNDNGDICTEAEIYDKLNQQADEWAIMVSRTHSEDL